MKDPEHIRKYDVFKRMEKWVTEGPDDSMYAHRGIVIKKTATKHKRHPGLDTVGIVRRIFQAKSDEEIVIMEEGQGWRITVVDFPVPDDYEGPVADLLPDRKLIKPVEVKVPEQKKTKGFSKGKKYKFLGKE